jgi:N-acylneuraminate cytidylyltransferase
MWRLGPDQFLVPLLGTNGSEGYNQPRQELPQTYWQSGHVDAIRTATIREQGSMSGARIRPLLIDAAYSCDIDSETDWQRTEWILASFDRPLVRPRMPDARFPDPIRLIVLDFDGVLTDNRVWVGEDGEEWVACNRSDGLGLDAVRRLGIGLFVISTEANPVVGARCRKLGLEYAQGVPDKAACLEGLVAQRGLDMAQVVYVGNDINDLPCMRLVGCAVAVADAHSDVLAEADVVLTRAGGHAAVRELCDRVCRHLGAFLTGSMQKDRAKFTSP